MTRLSNELAKHEKVFIDAVNQIAVREFYEIINPWLIKKGYVMYTGMGGWAIYDPSHPYPMKHEELPNRIREILEQRIPLWDGNDLGSLMPCHPKED